MTKPIYVEQPPEALSIRDEAELRILAGFCANSALVTTIEYGDLLSAAKTLADFWVKART
jgi:hypothetical protein